MKLGLISDTHFGADNLRWTVGAMAAMRDWCCEHGIKQVVHLGDFWKHRSPIPVAVLDAVGRELANWRLCGVQLTVIAGNHDQADREGAVHALRVLAGGGVVTTVCDEPDVLTWDDGTVRTAVVPYRDMAALPAAVGGLRGRADFLLGHFGVRGALMNDRVRDTTGLEARALASFKRVLLGHYHKPHNVGRSIVYVGSPVQHNFGEEGEAKGWAVLDTNENRIDYVPYAEAPQHHTIEWDGVGALPALPAGVREHDKLRVRVKGEAAIIASPAVKAALGSLRGGASVQIEAEPVVADKSRIGVTAQTPLAEMIRKFVETSGTELDRERLVALGAELAGG